MHVLEGNHARVNRQMGYCPDTLPKVTTCLVWFVFLGTLAFQPPGTSVKAAVSLFLILVSRAMIIGVKYAH